MIDAIRSEFRKLVTIRSTYVIAGICLLLVILFAFYAQGIREPGDLARNRFLLSNVVLNTVSIVGFLIAIAGMLLVSHEYRYNMITYTLTTSPSRARVLLAKAIVVSLFAVVLTLAFAVIAPLLTYLGSHVIKGAPVAPQQFDVWNLLWRSAVAAWGYAMFGFIIALLIRSQVGAITAFLFFPATVEQLLGLLLKNNSMYLPFTVLQQVIGQGQAMADAPVLAPGKAAVVALLYVAVAGAITLVLFQKRDAN